MQMGDPPLFFHFAVAVHTLLAPFGASLMTSFNISTPLASALVALTTFLMMRKLTKNSATSLTAAFFSAFVPASFRMMGELQKNAFGVALAPLPVLFLWRGLEGGKKLDFIISGIALGVVGLAHELAFSTLVIAYVCYLALLLAYRRRIPLREIKAGVIIAILAALICGAFYIGKLGTIGGLTGEGQAATLMVQGEQQPPVGQPINPTIYRFYDEYIGQLLFVFAAIGAGVAAYRRKATYLFLLAWGMSALIMAQPWIIFGYQWRFVIMLATPVVLLAAIGLIEGIGPLLWGAGKNLKTLFSKKETQKIVTIVGRAIFLCLLLFVVAQQVQASHNYAWTGEQLQPSITMEEYNAMQQFHQQFGDVYVFGGGEKFIYWPDAVGLKGTIQGGEVVNQLSFALYNSPWGQPNAMWTAVEWYEGQQQVGENIYALTSMEGPGSIQTLENEQLFKLIFSQSTLRAYALLENFVPPGNYLPPGPQGAIGFASQQQPLGSQEETSLVLEILLAPVYVISGAARFIVGVPLTVLLWVFLPCLVWEAIRRKISSEKLEKLRKGIIVGIVAVLVLTIVLTVKGLEMPMGPGPGPGSGPGPGKTFLPAGFEFVDGDKESWILKSTQIGGVLNQSLIRFDYLSEEPFPRCEQFGNLIPLKK